MDLRPVDGIAAFQPDDILVVASRLGYKGREVTVLAGQLTQSAVVERKRAFDDVGVACPLCHRSHRQAFLLVKDLYREYPLLVCKGFVEMLQAEGFKEILIVQLIMHGAAVVYHLLVYPARGGRAATRRQQQAEEA